MPTFKYSDPQTTSTLEDFRACQSADDPSYHNFSFLNKLHYEYLDQYIDLTTYSVVSDYLEDIKEEYCTMYEMTDDEFIRYKYRPKLLAWDKYKHVELGYILLLLNDMYSVKQFTKKNILMPNSTGIKLITQFIFNANKVPIAAYNS